MSIRRVPVFVVLCMLSVGVACSGNVPGVPPGTPPPSCVAPGCVILASVPQAVKLPAIAGTSITVLASGSGHVAVRDSAKPLGGSVPLLTAAMLPLDTNEPLFYVRITAIDGTAMLTRIPGFRLVFSRRVPAGPLRLAVLEDGVWTTVGRPGVVRGKTVRFAARGVSPAIRLRSGDSYEMGIYSGGLLPTPSPSPTPTPSASPTPTPTASPTPGAMTVTVSCTQSADACTSGTTSTAGSVQFTAIGDTAVLTPKQTGAATFTLASDTCNKTDDPSAGGNWARFSPAAGRSASSFKVTAASAGTTGNPAKCSAVLTGAGGQRVTVKVEVTLGNIGINGR